MFPHAFCGIEKIVPVQRDLVVRFAQECAVTCYDAIVCQERGNHVDKVAPRKKDMVKKTEEMVEKNLTIVAPVKFDVKWHHH